MNNLMHHELVDQLQGLTVGQALRRSASTYPNHAFFKTANESVNFGDFDLKIDHLACALLSLGIRRGDHVAVWLGNSLEWASCFFACARIGAVVIPINTRYTANEAAYIIKQSDSKVLVMTGSLFKIDFPEMLKSMAPEIVSQQPGEIRLNDFPSLQHIIGVETESTPYAHDFSQLLRTPIDRLTLDQAEKSVHWDDVLIICYTSGTTGHPKGVMHNHGVIKQATRVGLALDLKAGDRLLGHMPLYHVAGLYMGLVPAMTLGACFINMPHWDSSQALDLMEREHITTFGGIPTHFVDLVNDPSLPGRNLSNIRNAWIGGAPVMRSTFERFKKLLGIHQLMSTYGMTENTISTTFNRLDDPIERCCLNQAPILGPTEISLIDPNTGEACAPGEVGEVWCRGETVMLGYYKNPQATHETITPEGWLRTGDLGCMDRDGYLSITGRLKEMFKSGGTNVYPAEIEQHLVKHESIKLVAVVGVPDERLSEVGFAFVECHDGQNVTLAELRAFCKGALASYKVPKYLKIVPAIPRTSTGKIQKGALTELAKKELKLS